MDTEDFFNIEGQDIARMERRLVAAEGECGDLRLALGLRLLRVRSRLCDGPGRRAASAGAGFDAWLEAHFPGGKRTAYGRLSYAREALRAGASAGWPSPVWATEAVADALGGEAPEAFADLAGVDLDAPEKGRSAGGFAPKALFRALGRALDAGEEKLKALSLSDAAELEARALALVSRLAAVRGGVVAEVARGDADSAREKGDRMQNVHREREKGVVYEVGFTEEKERNESSLSLPVAVSAPEDADAMQKLHNVTDRIAKEANIDKITPRERLALMNALEHAVKTGLFANMAEAGGGVIRFWNAPKDDSNFELKVRRDNRITRFKFIGAEVAKAAKWCDDIRKAQKAAEPAPAPAPKPKPWTPEFERWASEHPVWSPIGVGVAWNTRDAKDEFRKISTTL